MLWGQFVHHAQLDIVFVLLCYFYSRSLIFAFIWSTSATHSALLYNGGFSFFYYVSRGERRGGGGCSANASGNNSCTHWLLFALK